MRRLLARPGGIRRGAFALAATLTLTGVPGTAAAPTARPNVVVIMTDDQTIEQMRVMQYTRSLIGDQGMTFERSFSSFPLCCPSRSTFLTGQYAHNHGVLENQAPTGGYYRLNSKNTLPVWLQRAGYRTIHVGKYLNAYGTRNPEEVPPGWTEWHATVDPDTYRMWGYRMNDNGTLSEPYGDYDHPDVDNYQTDVFARVALDQIHDAAQRANPFFMTLWFLAPHREVSSLSEQTGPRPALEFADTFANEPMPMPPSFNEKDMSDKPLFMRLKPSLDNDAVAAIVRQYRNELGALLSVDKAVKAVVEKLAAEGVLDNTYVVFTSDNGYFHGEHRTPDEKILGYENSVRVPLLVRGPGITPGARSKELVANVDLAPTIAELTGARPGLTMDGRSLKRFFAHPTARSRRPILLQAYMPVGSTLQFFVDQIPVSLSLPTAEGMEAALPLPNIPLGKAVLPYQAIRTGRYVYIEYVTGEHELYDLARDPWQLHSKHLDPAYARTQIALALELLKLRLCGGDRCRAETGPIPGPA